MPTKQPQAPFIFGFEHNRAHTPRVGCILEKTLNSLEAPQTRPFSPLSPSPLLSPLLSNQPSPTPWQPPKFIKQKKIFTKFRTLILDSLHKISLNMMRTRFSHTPKHDESTRFGTKIRDIMLLHQPQRVLLIHLELF